jgi:type IV pilus assembly protein PilA
MKKTENKGFTLLEILLVVAAIAILAGIVIIAINPNKQLGDTRNAQRRSDVNTILNAVYQYALDNNGVIPPEMASSTATLEICRLAPCTGYADLTALTTNEKYIISIPIDPNATTTSGTGYYIRKTVNNRIAVTALAAEQDAIISVSR